MTEKKVRESYNFGVDTKVKRLYTETTNQGEAMVEKRFYIKCDEFNAWSVWEADKDVVVFDLLKSDAQLVCDKLNEQYEELGNRKRIIKVITNEYNELEQAKNLLLKENEQLKHEINYLENRLDDCICLKKENKDLKEENLELSQKILKGLFEDENDELRKENKKLKEELEWCRMTVDGLKGD